MSDEILRNDSPDNMCFGCSPHNARGLRLEFRGVGPREVESRYEAAPHLCGAPGVIHGGIQAALLDEVMGMAIHRALGDEAPWIVTVDFQLEYLRPVSTETPIVLRGRCLRSEGREHFVEGEIQDGSGNRLTVAQARWKSIRRPANAPARA